MWEYRFNFRVRSVNFNLDIMFMSYPWPFYFTKLAYGIVDEVWLTDWTYGALKHLRLLMPFPSFQNFLFIQWSTPSWWFQKIHYQFSTATGPRKIRNILMNKTFLLYEEKHLASWRHIWRHSKQEQIIFLPK